MVVVKPLPAWSLFLTLAIARNASATPLDPPACAYSKFTHAKTAYHAIHADLNRYEITASVHYSDRLTSFWRVVGKVQPVAAITGTFFAWENQQPVADVIVNGQQKAKGYRGSVLAVDWHGQVHIFDVPTKSPADYEGFRYALRGTVRVVSDGTVKPNPKAQGFRDPRIWGRAPRTAVGITKANKVVMVATAKSITLSELGNAMKSIGVTNAVSLDGGGSTMLYFMGDIKVSSQRPLSTVFLLEKKSPYDDVFKRYIDQNRRQNGLAALQTGW